MRLSVFASALFLGGCALAYRQDDTERQVLSEVQRSERMALESQTLSSLAALERSLNDFIQAKGSIPERLDELVPEFLARIPVVELGLSAHRDSSAVNYYSNSAIVNGQVDGTRLKDSGGWGYVFNQRQVIVFVDCTHKSLHGPLWFQARGVF